ncbi:MAG TPA: hypothetical protein VG963_32640 [Polyangiaceae bacterium]|nr:hypothetical protein [Polyangiaceae bacterium]
MTRAEIQAGVRALLPSHDASDVNRYVHNALDRMSKVTVRHYRKDDSFCLTHEERARLAEGLARLALLNEAFGRELDENLDFVAEGMKVDLSTTDREPVHERLRRIIERFLFERGEAFVEALSAGQEMLFVHEELVDVCKADCLVHADISTLRAVLPDLAAETVERTLRHPTEEVQEYLRSISDGYTLLAFLRETPNVQAAISKLFTTGEFWIDTILILPMIAEQMLEPAERGYSKVIEAARLAGARLMASQGVLEELLYHLDNCYKAWRSPDTWRSRTPFLFAAYIWSGADHSQFPRMLDDIRGRSRPRDDLIDYLHEVLGIGVGDLGPDAQTLPEELRWHSDAYWTEVHAGRRNADPAAMQQLASHDSECFLGVIARRQRETAGSPFGHSTWWLTVDRHAGRAAADIRDRAGIAHLDTPVMSIDFLTYYLIVGPARTQLERSRERQLPLVADAGLLDALPNELMAAANRARDDASGRSDRLVRRAIRDHLDREKLRPRGVIKRTGIESIRDDIRVSLQKKAWNRNDWDAPEA